MYLRKKWERFELLSREGEIAIAKRIRSRETMIGGFETAPVPLNRLLPGMKPLLKGDILLREVIDLTQT